MKKLLNTAAVLLIAAIAYANGPKGETYTVSQKVSKLEWTGKKVTGQHNGTIEVNGGNIMVDGGKIVGGTVDVNMNTIVVSDLKDPEMNGKLKGHLMSDDFFGVANYPTASLKILEVKEQKDGSFHIHGDLTIKGITEKVEIPATIKMENDKVVAIGEATIDRTKFNIQYGSGKFFEDLGDKMIYDDFVVKFKVGAMK